MPNIDHTGFQELLYDIFHGGKSPYPLADIATIMGVDYQTLSGWTRGKNYFPPDLVRNLYNATVTYDQQHGRKTAGDERIWLFMLAGTGLRVTGTVRPDGDTVQKDLLDISVILGELVKRIQEAGDEIDALECERISTTATQMIRETEGIIEKCRGAR